MKRALLFVATFVVCQLLVTTVGGALLGVLGNLTGDAEIAENWIYDPLTLSALSLIADFVVVGASYALLRAHGPVPFSRSLRRWIGGRRLGLILLTSAVCIFFINLLCEAIAIPDLLENQFADLSHNPLGIFLLAIAGPFAEEFVFRRCVEGSLLGNRRWRRHAIWISALLFGLVHFNPAQIFGAFLLGLLLGWLYQQTRSLWPSLLCHILNNTIAVAEMQVFSPETKISQIVGNQVFFFLSLIGSTLFSLILLRYLFHILHQ